MSSSGLIYAVIVGAWAAYLVPMWLRRQDELNEARPTERFSTAIRLLAGRSGLERRASRVLDDAAVPSESNEPADPTADRPAPSERPTGAATLVGLPADEPSPGDAPSVPPAPPVPSAVVAEHLAAAHPARARLLARRRRMVTVLFLAFALGAIVAAVAGFSFLWVPLLPAMLLTLYIGHLRRLERQRCVVKLDRGRAATAAQRLREREQARSAADPVAAHPAEAEPQAQAEPAHRPPLRVAPAPQQALVEATDHEEWVDGLRERAAAGRDSWEPVPVPLPTYVTAPVAPRVSRGLDLGAPGTWNSGRTTEPAHTPLFDQYEEPLADPRPRAANE
ncbi:hypothetical protein C7C46_09985 [Streptomyces tateyamensis]|uniref:Uncharacterized protein n=1 Tax=Streptomyces tateyamensis TaxID=565073 RepID=A0A2V4P0A4_9ACTN|nr:gephyrin-like molybdotransferase receptor GlpR [Streptomyces tateyamensis]PYC82676.1 hypothetical protein C7C46_09985 [Streptomyces tateyamensis]